MDEITSDDMESVVGAYLLYRLTRQCSCCGVEETPLWRKGWHDGILERRALVCNACGLKIADDNYCQYCKRIRFSADTGWIDCARCTRCVHLDCECVYCDGLNVESWNYICHVCIEQ